MKMTNSGFKKKLEEAKENSKRVRLMFQYPGVILKKSGNVLDVTDDSFTINEKFDGECVYSYSLLVEISDDNDGDRYSKMDINKGGHVERGLGKHGTN